MTSNVSLSDSADKRPGVLKFTPPYGRRAQRQPRRVTADSVETCQ